MNCVSSAKEKKLSSQQELNPKFGVRGVGVTVGVSVGLTVGVSVGVSVGVLVFVKVGVGV